MKGLFLCLADIEQLFGFFYTLTVKIFTDLIADLIDA